MPTVHAGAVRQVCRNPGRGRWYMISIFWPGSLGGDMGKVTSGYIEHVGAEVRQWMSLGKMFNGLWIVCYDKQWYMCCVGKKNCEDEVAISMMILMILKEKRTKDGECLSKEKFRNLVRGGRVGLIKISFSFWNHWRMGYQDIVLTGCSPSRYKECTIAP